MTFFFLLSRFRLLRNTHDGLRGLRDSHKVNFSASNHQGGRSVKVWFLWSLPGIDSV